MKIKLKNTITGKYFSHGNWDADSKSAEEIEKDSPVHIVIRHTWDMSHTVEITENHGKGLELMEKAKKMRENAGCNRATNSRNTRVKNMLIGRADALEAKARSLMAPRSQNEGED